jgi:hypothetical protein
VNFEEQEAGGEGGHPPPVSPTGHIVVSKTAHSRVGRVIEFRFSANEHHVSLVLVQSALLVIFQVSFINAINLSYIPEYRRQSEI